MDAQNFLTMSMDELANEISETKKKLSALEQLMKIRQQLGERTTRQIEAKKKAEKRAALKNKTTSSTLSASETIAESQYGQDFFSEREEF
ncbi:MAG: hypothetical protein K6A61_02105 [Butyrivibrio sp.]|jgi:hypothetical protein|uniref:Uncharacterized protein n=1 Tax=Butyrivibrio hungatei TaxID=185008 RepID=A0A1G5AAX4_9FIRM|nr:hypothetical protein [Butyrivibrio hungatei]MBQ2610003.1 hypothetical protein [Butyrivibrio sp.]MBQ4218314.1 hypothetical protein [Butyrivibrio sp.]MBR4356391.1 hypothetical protein [Butyrivibrio sp.]MBR4640523.1 hypothetical protein [Butyrivibrio sp.]MCR4996073.1 hypothetical protein [Butyrivibrio sp.]